MEPQRASIFVSHKVAMHRAAAERIKAIFEARTERLDVFICEDIRAGDDWQSWIQQHLSHSQMLLVLWPAESAGLDCSWIEKEIRAFDAACPGGRRVVLHADDSIPPSASDRQAIKVCKRELTERLLNPLYSEPSFMNLDEALNARVPPAEVLRDAEELERAFFGNSVTRTEWYHELLIIEPDPNARHGLDDARVQAGEKGLQILNWTQPQFSWGELCERAQQDKAKGTFWLAEIEQVIRQVENRECPAVMTSTFRGRGASAGRIYQPQLEQVDFADDDPVRYYFGFHEVLVPEIVRGPGQIGEVFNMLHIAARVRWEVLNPFLVKLGTRQARRNISSEERDAVVARVMGSLRAIELESSRHNMLQEAAADAFEGTAREQVLQMLKERDSLLEAIKQAIKQNDFDGLMECLGHDLQLNCEALELVVRKFLQLLLQDNKRLLPCIKDSTAISAPTEGAAPQAQVS